MSLQPIFQHPDVYVPQIQRILHDKESKDRLCLGFEDGINPDSPCRLFDASVRPDTNGYPRLYLKGDRTRGFPELQVKLHHAVMVEHRYNTLGPDSFAWEADISGQGLVLAHRCHQKYCKVVSHMALVPKGVNTNQSQQNCFDFMMCDVCMVRMPYPCMHGSACGRCIAVVHTVCSSCSQKLQSM